MNTVAAAGDDVEAAREQAFVHRIAAGNWRQSLGRAETLGGEMLFKQLLLLHDHHRQRADAEFAVAMRSSETSARDAEVISGDSSTAAATAAA